MQTSTHPVGSQCPKSRTTGAALGDLQEKRQYDWEEAKLRSWWRPINVVNHKEEKLEKKKSSPYVEIVIQKKKKKQVEWFYATDKV